MHTVSANFWAAVLLAVEAVTAGHVHLELMNSIEARSKLERREYDDTEISHIPDTPWYYVDVWIGNPGQELKLRLDGRGSTWLPWLSRIDDTGDCLKRYPQVEEVSMCKYAGLSGLFNPEASKTFRNITNSPELNVDYESSRTRGTFGTDDLQLNQITVEGLTMGLADSFGSSPSLGLGLPEDPKAYPYESFLQKLQSQGKINSLVYSLYLNDLYSPGDIYFGAIDQAKFYGNLQRFKNLDGGLESHITINGAWWTFTNDTSKFKSMVSTNREDDGYFATSSLIFGSTNIGLPQETFDHLLQEFAPGVLTENGGVWSIDCSSNIDIGFLHIDIGHTLYNISSRQLFSNEQRDGDKCTRFLAADVTEKVDERTPFFRLGDPFLRGAYAVFDYTNRQTLIAPAIINATSAKNVMEVGANDAEVSGTGSKLPAAYSRIPAITIKDVLAPGTPVQPGSDPTQSKAIIVGGILGGIVVLVLVLGAVYAIRPRSQRSRDFKTWFTFIKPKSRKPSPDPEIAYPARHDSRYYQSGTSRITSVSHGPPQPPAAVHANGSTSPTGSNGGISPIQPQQSEQSFYVNTAFRPTRLSNVDEAVEMAPASSASSSRYPQYQQPNPNRYSTSKYDGNYIRINS